MEILIGGGIIVLLMVFLSTKIKQSAAVETAEFTISKPAGFMTPLNDKSEYAFEARSREFGEKKTRNIWQAHAFLTVKDGANFQAACIEAKKKAGKIAFEKTFKADAGGEKICLLESEERIDEASMIVFRKIVESRARKKIYNLQISVLPAFRPVYIDRINEMMESFRIK